MKAVTRALYVAATVLMLALVVGSGAALFAQGDLLRASDLAGLRLRNIGPANMSGRFVDMDVVESNPYTMYVASATGGLWRTTDNGITWTPVFEREAVHSIGDVAIYQPDPKRTRDKRLFKRLISRVFACAASGRRRCPVASSTWMSSNPIPTSCMSRRRRAACTAPTTTA